MQEAAFNCVFEWGPVVPCSFARAKHFVASALCSALRSHYEADLQHVSLMATVGNRRLSMLRHATPLTLAAQRPSGKR